MKKLYIYTREYPILKTSTIHKNKNIILKQMEYRPSSNYKGNSCCLYHKPAKRLPECTCKKIIACRGTCI